MSEQKFDLCMKIHNILRKNIKGRIFISNTPNGLYVNINPGNNINYRHSISDTSDYFSIYDIARKIESHYRSWLQERFFYQNN